MKIVGVRKPPREIEFGLLLGEVYTANITNSPDCQGHSYLIEKVVIALPSGQIQLLVKGLTGPDKDDYMVCSAYYFAIRFSLRSSESSPDN